MAIANQQAQRGSALVVVMIILIALLAAGAVAIRLQMSDTRSTGLVRQSRDSLFCAEAGLAAARETVANWGREGRWNSLLTADTADDPTGYPISVDTDGDTEEDYNVVIVDNDDGDGNPEADADQRVFIVSTCTRNANTPRTVRELIRFNAIANSYSNQAGQGADAAVRIKAIAVLQLDYGLPNG